MIRYAIVDNSGIVVGTGVAQSKGHATIAARGSGKAVKIPDGSAEPVPLATRYSAGRFFPLPARPGDWAVWKGSRWIDPRTEEDHAAEREMRTHQIRADRDRRLAASDWTQMPDAPLTDDQRIAWRAYRQALRDLMADCDPDNVVWPEIPTNKGV